MLQDDTVSQEIIPDLDSLPRRILILLYRAFDKTGIELRRRIDALVARKRFMEQEQRTMESRYLLEFLQLARSQKQTVPQNSSLINDTIALQDYEKLGGELTMLDRDIERVKQRMQREEPILQAPLMRAIPEANGANQNDGDPEVPYIPDEILQTPKRPCIASPGGPSVTSTTKETAGDPDINEVKALITKHFSDLQEGYFDFAVDDDPLEKFGAKISQLKNLTRIRQVSALKLGDIGGSSNIVSSIEFDRDSHIFATAGVSKRIRYYEFRDSLNVALELHCPVRELVCKSKISCITWNPYIRQQLASADYEGLVTVYDSEVGVPIITFEEHEKRSWSCDFSTTDPTRLASGSDDSYVKLWSSKVRRSICTVDGKANVCSVRFHPEQGHLLAFGSADHNVHLYDLRYASKPLDVMKGHRKAVSYVRFADDSTIVSASTDCTLRQWSLPGYDNARLPTASATLRRTYSGHINEKNFVGLGVEGDLFACGSENNAVYVYHRDLSKPLASFAFSSICPLTGNSLENEVQQFVSSLCWKRDSNMLVAANSQGNIRILEIV